MGFHIQLSQSLIVFRQQNPFLRFLSHHCHLSHRQQFVLFSPLILLVYADFCVVNGALLVQHELIKEYKLPILTFPPHRLNDCISKLHRHVDKFSLRNGQMNDEGVNADGFGFGIEDRWQFAL